MLLNKYIDTFDYINTKNQDDVDVQQMIEDNMLVLKDALKLDSSVEKYYY